MTPTPETNDIIGEPVRLFLEEDVRMLVDEAELRGRKSALEKLIQLSEDHDEGGEFVSVVDIKNMLTQIGKGVV